MTRARSLKSRNKKLQNRLGRLLKVQTGEAGPLLLIGGAIMATEAGYWMGGNGVDGLVFGRLGSEVLPYLLMLKGVLAFGAITLYTRWLVQINRRRMLIITTLATFVVLLASRVVIGLEPPEWFYVVLWPISYVVPDLFMLQAWALAGEAFDSRQNKRLFPLITALGSIGVVAGNFLTAPLAQELGSANLLLIWCGLVLAAFAALLGLRRRLDRAKAKRRGRSEAEKERVEGASVAESLRSGFAVVRYYKIIGLMVVGTTLMYILYYALFKVYITQVNDHFNDLYPGDLHQRTDAITGFFGLVGGFSTLLSFLLGLLVVNRLFARLGVRNLVLAMPLTNLLSFGAILAATSFNVVVGARFVHLMMTEALGSSVNQTVYNLLPPETRETATPFNNQGISKQGGVVLAGLLLLLSLVSLPLVLGLAFVISIIYVYVALRMRSLYRPSLVQLLREGQQSFFDEGGTAGWEDAPLSLALDEDIGGPSADGLQAAIVGLGDSSEGTRRLSAELLGQGAASEAVRPLMKSVLTDPSGEVRRTAIYALTQLGATQAAPTIAEALSDAEAPVRAEAAGALRRLKAPLDYAADHFLNRALTDRDPTVRREAALTLLNYGRKGEAFVTLWEMGRASEAPFRREAAAAYGEVADRMLTHCLTDLLDDFQPEVRRQAAISLRQSGGLVAARALLTNLEDNDPSVREEIALSLAALRQYTAGPLLQYLFKTRNEDGSATALRALTVAKLDEKRLARRLGLERQLQSRQLPSPAGDSGLPPGDPFADGVGFDLTPLEQSQLLEYGQQQLDYAARMAGYLTALNALDLAARRQSDRPQRREAADLSVLLKSLRERYDGAVLRAVDVAGLLGDVEALALVGAGLQAQGRRAARMRADAIETLDNFGDVRLTPRLVSLLEGHEPSVLMARRPGRTMSDILLEIWREHDAWLQACVLYVIGVFELRRLRPLVAEAVMIEGENDYLIEETGREALQRLDRDQVNLALLIGENLPSDQEAPPMQTLGTLSTMSRLILLQKVPIFANLRPEDLRRVALVCKERLFSPGEVICYEGDPGDELYIVSSGQVQVLTGFGSPNHRVLAVNGEGEAVGMMAILDDIPRSATLRATNGPVRLLILAADEFKRILRERPEMAAEVIRVLSQMLRATNRRVQDNADLDS